MRVDIWTDVVCPFCYIGQERFDKALNEFSDKENVEIKLHSFLLAPNYKPKKESVYEYMAYKNNLTLEQAKQLYDDITRRAAEDGIVINFNIAVPCNTVKMHQLLHYAQTIKKDLELELLFYKAYFNEGKDLNDINVLAQICSEVGINAQTVEIICINGEYINNINDDIRKADELGVNGVPFFLFDNKVQVSGAQSSEYFLDVMNSLRK